MALLEGRHIIFFLHHSGIMSILRTNRLPQRAISYHLFAIFKESFNIWLFFIII